MTAAAANAPEAVPDTSGIAGHPKGLSTLFFTEMWERFSYYGMRAILILFMVTPVAAGGLGFDTVKAAGIYGLYTGSVYFTTIPGGWIADRLLGLRRAVLVGGVLIACGHYSLLLARTTQFFYAGLLLIVLGTGLLKANISAIVGQLYVPGDPRRDAGFSIFYMGINLGGFISPLICGGLAQKIGWHWGFGAAGVGMTLGLVQYVVGQHRFGRAGLLLAPPRGASILWAKAVGGVVLAGLGLWAVWPWRDYVVLAGTAGLFVWLLRTGADTPVERKRIGAIMVLFVFAVLFWIGFEQAGSSLTLFADQNTSNTILGWGFPSSWYQSVESFFVVSLAPVFAWLWLRLGRREPSSPAKFAYALLSLSLGFLVIAVAAHLHAASGSRVSPWWLIALYFLHALGELSLSPVGLSTVTKLAPTRIVGMMMGVWFLALSLGNFLAGTVAGFFDRLPLPQLFGSVCLTTAISGLALALLVKPIRALMGGVH
ncbi:MAG: peptide MFS transporter [Vicinamibacteria bacterium]